jgi:hypothetical protein
MRLRTLVEYEGRGEGLREVQHGEDRDLGKEEEIEKREISYDESKKSGVMIKMGPDEKS